MIASLRRNSRVASDRASQQYASASNSAASAQSSLSDQLLESWSDSQIKEWFDKNNIKVPQGSKRNELVALARKNAARLSGGDVASSGSSAFHAATTSAGNMYAQATSDAYAQFRYYYDYALNNFGMASADAKASLSSASSKMSVAASQLSVTASKSASSASKQASKSGGNAASAASSAASEASAEASKRAKQEL